MNKNDFIRLRHMLEAAKEAIGFVENKSRPDLEDDRMLVLSIVKSVEIIGEAPSRVTKETRKKYLEIPWSEIVGMRNRPIHVYFDIDLDRVWDTVSDDLPPLVDKLEKILFSERPQ